MAVVKTRMNRSTLARFLTHANFEEATLAAQEAKRTIASFRTLVETIIKDETRGIMYGPFFDPPVLSGTVIAYTHKDKPLGDTIEHTFVGEFGVNLIPTSFVTRVFPVPKKYRNVKNRTLVVTHPNFTIERKDGFHDSVAYSKKPEIRYTIRASESDIHLVEGFPRGAGWYHIDPKFYIPFGEAVPKPEELVNRGTYGDFCYGLSAVQNHIMELSHLHEGTFVGALVLGDSYSGRYSGVTESIQVSVVSLNSLERRHSVLVESSGLQLENLFIERNKGKLIVKGTVSDVLMVARLLEAFQIEGTECRFSIHLPESETNQLEKSLLQNGAYSFNLG